MGTAYCSPSQRCRSTCRQRTLQKGIEAVGCNSAVIARPQMGHLGADMRGRADLFLPDDFDALLEADGLLSDFDSLLLSDFAAGLSLDDLSPLDFSPDDLSLPELSLGGLSAAALFL